MFRHSHTMYVILLVIFATSLPLADAYEKRKTYSDKFDHIEIEEILSDGELVDQYWKCFSRQGPCLTPDAKYIRDILPEIVITKCQYCTERQKEAFQKVFAYLADGEKEPEVL